MTHFKTRQPFVFASWEFTGKALFLEYFECHYDDMSSISSTSQVKYETSLKFMVAYQL